MSQELTFVLFIIGIIVMALAIKLVRAGLMIRNNKKAQAETREFYTEVEKEVNKRKK